MRLSYAAWALALCAPALAFTDTSPFVLLSTAQFVVPALARSLEEQRHRLTRAISNRYPDGPIQDQLQTSSQVESTAKDFLSSCPTDRYLVVLQPNLSPDELRGANSQSAP